MRFRTIRPVVFTAFAACLGCGGPRAATDEFYDLTRIFHCSNVAGVIRSPFVSNPVVVVGKGNAVRTSPPFPRSVRGWHGPSCSGGYGGAGAIRVTAGADRRRGGRGRARGYPVAMRTTRRRTLLTTRAPILKSRNRIVPTSAWARSVPARAVRRT